MNEPVRDDRWAAADAYEMYMGRWSRALAREFVAWIGAPRGRSWLDVGCGTGALTSAICELAEPSSVVACDPSEAFVESLRAHVADPRVSAVAAGSDDLPRRTDGFDLVASSLVLNFVPDPAEAVAAMRDRTSAGGTVSACVWDYAAGLEFVRIFWDEAGALDPSVRALDEAIRFPLCQPDALRSVFVDAGLRDVVSGSVAIRTRFDTFDDYWEPFLGATGPAPSYVASLTDEGRASLRDRLQRRLSPGGAERSIDLGAQAWVIRGTAN